MRYDELIVGTLLVIGALGSLLFVIGYVRSPWFKTPAGRHLMAVTAVTGVEFSSLTLLIFIDVPWWIFAVEFALGDVVIYHRLVLLLRAHRREDARE